MTMTTNPLYSKSVGEIAAQLPGAPGVFRRFDISFCCHGDSSLAEAAKRNNHALEAVIKALDALDPSAAPEVPQETGALIDHIQTRFHDVHRQQIPELIELSSKVERVHASKPGVPAGLTEVLEKIQGEMEEHMREEEEILFPAMRNAAANPIAVEIGNYRQDHEDTGRLLDEIARLTDSYTPPAHACRSWQALYKGAEQFRADLTEHIHLENNILFPRFEATTAA